MKESEKLDIAGILLFSNILFVVILAWMSQEMWFLPIRDVRYEIPTLVRQSCS